MGPGILYNRTEVGHGENKDYWDYYYRDYEDRNADGEVVTRSFKKPESCDHTQNCHGYTYGVGNHQFATPFTSHSGSGMRTP